MQQAVQQAVQQVEQQAVQQVEQQAEQQTVQQGSRRCHGQRCSSSALSAAGSAVGCGERSGCILTVGSASATVGAAICDTHGP